MQMYSIYSMHYTLILHGDLQMLQKMVEIANCATSVCHCSCIQIFSENMLYNQQ